IRGELDGRLSTEAEEPVIDADLADHHLLSGKAVFDALGTSDLHQRCHRAGSDEQIGNQEQDGQQAEQTGQCPQQAFHLLSPTFGRWRYPAFPPVAVTGRYSFSNGRIFSPPAIVAIASSTPASRESGKNRTEASAKTAREPPR